MPKTLMLVPCSFAWTLALDESIEIQQVRGIDPAEGAILVAQKPGSKIKGTPLGTQHQYQISEAFDGQDQWVMPLAPGIEHGIAHIGKGRKVVALRSDKSKNIVTFQFTDKNKNCAEAFLVTPIPPAIAKSQLKNLEPLKELPVPDANPTQLFAMVSCSRRWHLEVAPGIAVEVADIEARPLDGSVLRVSHSDKTGKKPLTIALSSGGKLAVARALTELSEDDEDETNPGMKKTQEWLLRLADGIRWRVDLDARRLTLDSGDENHHIVAIKLIRPAEIAFIVTPVPPDNFRTAVEKKPSKNTLIPA